MSEPSVTPFFRSTGRAGCEPARRVLVVDDEEALAALVGKYLDRDGFIVDLAVDGVQAVETARITDPDVVVLDLGLPGLDGLEVCRRIRTFSDCYVIMLTARGEEVDKVAGLSVGADDYLTKPFSPRELVARVHAMLRRPRRGVGGQLAPADPWTELLPDPSAGPSAGSSAGTPVLGDERLRFGPLMIDLPAREVCVSGRVVELTRTEFDVLAALAARPRLVFSRRQLIDVVWGAHWVGDEHLVDVHIGHLRRKLGDAAGAGRFIRTVRGVGYRMGEG